jgi:hypothetical protein
MSRRTQGWRATLLSRLWQVWLSVKLRSARFEGYICAWLSRMQAPNGVRYAPTGYWWVGRDNAALTESASTQKCLKTQRVSPRPQRSPGVRAHAMLGSNTISALVICLQNVTRSQSRCGARRAQSYVYGLSLLILLTMNH